MRDSSTLTMTIFISSKLLKVLLLSFLKFYIRMLFNLTYENLLMYIQFLKKKSVSPKMNQKIFYIYFLLKVVEI